MRLIEVLKNAFKVKDLRKKIGMTLLLVIIFRIGCFITVPGLQDAALDSLAGNGLFKFMDMLSGGAFQQVSIFSLGISPYINASIIMQLLTVAIPFLEKKQKDPDGRKQLSQWTRYASIGLGLLQAVMLYFNINNPATTINLFAAPGKFDLFTFLLMVVTFSAGTAALMWLGEKITEVGIGNGISMIIFAGIISAGPRAAISLPKYFILYKQLQVVYF